MRHLVSFLAWTLAVGVTATARAAAPTPSVEAQLRALKNPVEACRSYSEQVWTNLGLTPPPVVLGVAATSKNPVQVLQRHYSVSEPAARVLMETALLRCERHGRWDKEDQEAQRAKMEHELQLLERGAAAAPGHPAILLAMLTSSAAHSLESFPSRFVAALDRAKDPARTALLLAGGGDHLFHWRVRLLALAVQRSPELLGEAVARVGLDTSESTLSFLVDSLQRSLAATPRPDHLPALSEQTLRALLRGGHTALAVDTFRKLPEDVQAALRAGTLRGEQGIRGDASRERVPAPDVRITLAAAFLALGDPATAQALFAGVPAPPPDGTDGPETSSNKARRQRARRHHEDTPRRVEHQVLSVLLANAKPDLFELVVTIEDCRECGDGVWALLLPKALGPHYVQTARSKLSAAVESLRYRQEESPRKRSRDPRDEALTRSLEMETERAQKALEELASKSEATAASSALVERLLSAPASTTFKEHVLPAGVRAYVEPPRSDDCRERPEPGVALPHGFHPVRVEKTGQQVAAIALSQKLDPTGELSGGGYWYFESKDGGREWSDPLYIGLREFQPYVVVPSSALPLRRGDVLQVEVQVRELDEESISFPPVALAAKREASGLYLEIPLAELNRDSDGDGLSDLTEVRLLTDPKSADSDADGLKDLEDPAPLISAKAPPSAAAPLLDAFFAHLNVGQRPEAVVTGIPSPEEREGGRKVSLPTRRGPVSSDHVLFVVGDREQFQGTHIDARVIVLSPAEVERVSKRFGRFYPLRLEPPIFDETGGRLFLRFNESWRGGTFTGVKQPDGSWVLLPGSFWIS